METWIIATMIVVLLVVAIAVFMLRKEKGNEPDYRVFFILGVTWLPLGIATDNAAFLGLGAVFMIVGLANRDKWKEQPKFSEMPEEKRRLKIGLIIGLTLVLALAVVVLFLAK